MTIRTARSGLAHRRQRAAVTVTAGDVDVATMQLETGLNIVIKQPKVPGDRVVTRLTVVFERPFVWVVLAMTVNASAGGVAKCPSFMANDALYVGVLTQQRKATEIVVVERCIRPDALVVTIAALLPQCRRVRLIVQVTSRASRAGQCLKDRLDVAINAGDRLVRAIQDEFRTRIVIKNAFCPCPA